MSTSIGASLPATPAVIPGGHGGSGLRQRILATATDLFYRLGIRAVGIDRIIAEAGVAKATFYRHFPAKDVLVCAYLAAHHEAQKAALDGAVAGGGDPAQTILAIFTAIGDLSCGPGFRGCAFVNAAVEYPDPMCAVRQVVAEHRRWFHDALRDLLIAAGHPRPDEAASVLVTLRDGLIIGAQVDEPAAVRTVLPAAIITLLAPL